MKKKIFLLIILILTMSTQSRAVIYVRLSGGDYDNFQAAVNAAVTAGGTQTIIVGDGTYLSSGNYNILIDTDGLNLTIKSENGPNNCTVDAQWLGRVFDIRNVNLADSVVIWGLTIQNGNAPDTFGGGGIFSHNSVLTVGNCNIINNRSTKGGGIYTGSQAGSLIMNNCIIADNICAASSGGGAMYVNSNVSVTVTDCTFRNNSISSPYMHGGGMYIANCDPVFTNCIFEGNYAYGNGGAFYFINGNLGFTNCTFTGNICTSNGGAGFVGAGSTTIVDVNNCIFRDNEAYNLGDTFYLITIPADDAILNYSYSDIDPSVQSINGSGTWNDLGGNINVDPNFAQPGYWDSGTWVSGDYHLMSMVGRWEPISETWVIDAVHSPCIDAGAPADGFAVEPTPNGNRINMGAYGNTTEASKSPYCAETLTADLNNDCYVDFRDFAEMASQWLMCDKQPPSLCWQFVP